MFQISEIISYHKTLGADHTSNAIWVCDDGVNPSKSSAINLHVFAIHFEDCLTVYPLLIFQPGKAFGKNAINPMDLRRKVLRDLDNHNTEILGFRGDAKVRCIWRNIKTPPAKMCCDYCEAAGTYATPEDAIDDVFRLQGFTFKKPGGKLTWGPCTGNNQTPRTAARLELLADLERITPKSEEINLKGVKGHSVLLEYQSQILDPIEDVHVDYMHTFIGVCTRVLECLFFPHIHRSKKCRPYPKDEIDSMLLQIRVPTEFSRRARTLDHANFKAAEYRDTCAFSFPALISVLHPDSWEQRAVAQMCFLLRAVLIPIEEFEESGIDLKKEQEKFYYLYHKAFGIEQCVYNTHMVGAHADKFRVAGTASHSSCFLFEGFFGKFSKWAEHCGTSYGKQIMKCALTELERDEHRHRRPLIFSDKETTVSQSNLFYTWSPSEGYHFYKIRHVLKDEGMLLCREIQYSNIRSARVDFSRVAAFRHMGISPNDIVMNKNLICGHAMDPCGWIVTVPNNCILEQTK